MEQQLNGTWNGTVEKSVQRSSGLAIKSRTEQATCSTDTPSEFHFRTEPRSLVPHSHADVSSEGNVRTTMWLAHDGHHCDARGLHPSCNFDVRVV